jgi:hypothetical protein
VHPFTLLAGLALVAAVLWDAFETVVLPRTVSRRMRLTQLYFRTTWRPWAKASDWYTADGARERFLAIFGPLSLLGLTLVWACGLMFGFAVVQWSIGSRLRTPFGRALFSDDLYLSGTTFGSLGLGDVQPYGRAARVLTVAEAGIGFGFLAIVITYLPVLYQSFSRREVRLTLLDAWAGSPPAAVEILRRLALAGELSSINAFLKDWEYWCSEVLESHISYPAVAYFRSQHQRQSWVAALTTVLDLSALVQVGIDGIAPWQAHVTFAIARHAAVDLAQVLNAAPNAALERLAPRDLERLRVQLEAVGLQPDRSPEADRRLAELRRSYEPYVLGLSAQLKTAAPAWWHETPTRDNWQTSPRRMHL